MIQIFGHTAQLYEEASICVKQHFLWHIFHLIYTKCNKDDADDLRKAPSKDYKPQDGEDTFNMHDRPILHTLGPPQWRIKEKPYYHNSKPV